MVRLGISAQQSHRIQRGVKASVKQTRWRRSGLALVIPIVVSWGGSAAAVEAQSALDGLTAEFLREAAEEIKQKDRSAAAREFEQETYPTEVGEEEAFQVTPARPAGAFDHAGQEATSAETESAPLARETLKMAPEEGEEEPIVPQPEPGARPLSFSSGSVMHQQGIDDRLETAVDAASAADAEERFTYAFALTSEYPSQQMEEELNDLGVEILGPHDDAVKIKLPLNREVLHELMNLAYVEWVGYSQPEQKIESTLAGAMASFADEVEEFPVIINLFEDDSDGRFAARLQEIGVALGHYDPDLQSYRAAASLAEIDALAALDFVLFIETERPTSPGHDQSMATMGVDYIRPGGSGTRFSGASTVLGIMDTGFMV
jgi:hypothetical protein